MSYCTFADGAAIYDATPIENLFLVEYLYDAPAPALKVYLYARMLALHPELGEGVEDVANALKMDFFPGLREQEGSENEYEFA